MVYSLLVVRPDWVGDTLTDKGSPIRSDLTIEVSRQPSQIFLRRILVLEVQLTKIE